MQRTTMLIAFVAAGCSSFTNGGQEIDAGNQGPSYSRDSGANPGSADEDVPDQSPNPPAPATFSVTLVADGVSGLQRVNFAVPLAPGALTDPTKVKIIVNGAEVPAARRALARYADGSVRSVQLQVDVNVTSVHALTVSIGAAAQSGPTMAAVQSTTAGNGANVHPKVWVVLPTSVLIGSGLGGPLRARSETANSVLDGWDPICNYDTWNTDAFLVNAQSSRDVWLYDRATAMYRGYFITGAISPLKSAYREAELYRAGMTITNGVATAIAPPTANDDLKYYYAQSMALHYLMSGDDRFREAAEAVSAKVATLWNPHYDGVDGFWTERFAGFALLAHEWALMVSDDQAPAIAARAETAVSAYLTGQMQFPLGYGDPDARCFGHSSKAADEDFGYTGCSPWMSAILADGLDQYARRVGGARGAEVRASLVKLGRSIARDGRDATGKPYYWMGEGNTSHQIDDFNEHWGEAAYVLALAWNASGRHEVGLQAAAQQLIAGFRAHGQVGQLRSFNWQCRSAVATPALMR